MLLTDSRLGLGLGGREGEATFFNSRRLGLTTRVGDTLSESERLRRLK